MTVLHILHAARAEGTVRLALDWLEDTRIRQEVVTLSAQPADLQPEIERRAAWYERGTRIPAGRVKFPWMLFRSWQVCRRRKPDMAICWMNGFSPWILAGARLAGVRRLITHAGNPPDRTPMGRAQTVFSTLVAWLTGGRMVCCSAYVAKPSWQPVTDCPMRTVADVSAAAFNIPVYNKVYGGWVTVAGTSASAPLIAGIYGLAGNGATTTQKFLYAHARSLFDITSGNNGFAAGAVEDGERYAAVRGSSW